MNSNEQDAPELIQLRKDLEGTSSNVITGAMTRLGWHLGRLGGDPPPTFPVEWDNAKRLYKLREMVRAQKQQIAPKRK